MRSQRPSAGGLPIGAVLVKQHVADVMLPGDHGSTFAGNPLVCHAANAVVDVISDPAFLSGVRAPMYTPTACNINTRFDRVVNRQGCAALGCTRLPGGLLARTAAASIGCTIAQHAANLLS